MKGIPPKIIGNGSQSMDFINVKDAVRANIMAMESNINNELVNVGSGTTTSISELANILITNLKVDVKPIFVDSKIRVMHRQADNSKIEKLLGFKPEIGLRKGLNEVVRDIKKNPKYY